MVQLSILLGIGIHPFNAITDAVVSNLFLAALCFFLINNLKYYLPKKEKYLYILVVSLAASALWMLLVRLALNFLFKNDELFTLFFLQTSPIRFAVAFLMVACCNMFGLLWFTQQEQQKDNQRKSMMEGLARDAELNKLRQQLQPHFLFNSLNSISALTGSQPEKARHMIQQLSNFFRSSLKKEDQQPVPLEEEMEYLQLYLDIEKVRFGYRLNTIIEKEDEALQMKLPPMILQPLVENAIKFGLYDTIGEVTIFITAKNNNGMLQVAVQNPFDELTAAPQKGTGFGLSSIRRRLFLLFGRHDLLEVKKEKEKFIAVVTIPQAA